MRAGPQIQCQECELPMLLSFAEPVGAGSMQRRLVCSWCGQVHVWSIVEVRGAVPEQPSLGSSVE